MVGHRRLILSLLVLAALWAVTIVVVNPVGDFPLNDDWLYARTVETFLHQGELIRPQLAAVSLVFQTLWGGACSRLFGFSHTVLRLSNIILHLVSVLAMAVLVSRRTDRHAMGLFAACVLLFSPLALLSAFSFMWEPSLAATLVLSLLSLQSWERTHQWQVGVILMVFSLCTVLVHPVALVLPLWLVIRALRREEGFVATAWPGIASFVLGLIFLGWYFTGSSSETMTGFWLARSVGFKGVLRVFERLPGAVVSLGLFMLPVGLRMLSIRRTPAAMAFLAWTWGQGLWVGGESPIPMPSLENTLTPSGLGYVGLQGSPPEIGAPFWWAISLLAIVSTVGLLGRLSWSSRLPVWSLVLLACFPWAGRLALGPSLLRAGIAGLLGSAVWAVVLWPTLRERGTLSLGLVWLVVFVFLPPFYDRYLVPLLPLFLVAFVPSLKRPGFVGWGAGLILAACSIGGTHDYLAVNRTRWDLLDDLVTQKGISPSVVDGGYEWAGWHYAWRGIPNQEKVDHRSDPWWITLWAPEIHPHYVVSVSALPGMVVEETRACGTIDDRWRIFLLRSRDASALNPE